MLRGEAAYLGERKLEASKEIDIAILQKAQIDRRSELNNSNSRCTLLDITLRFMDKHLKSLGIRWFFRPVDAYISDHRGVVSAEVRNAAQLEQQARKREVQKVKKQVQEKKVEEIKVQRQLKKEVVKQERAEVKAAEQQVLAAAKKGEAVPAEAVELLQKAEAAKAVKPTRKASVLAAAAAGKPRRRTMRRR